MKPHRVFFALGLTAAVACAVFALVSIWTGDGRWSATGAVAGVVAFAAGFIGMLTWMEQDT